MQIGARIVARRRAALSSSSGRGSSAWRALRRLIGPKPRERQAVAAVAGRHHAVEHVDAARHRFEKVVGRADAHQVARPVRRQERRDRLDHRQHHRLRLADREAADGVAVKADIDERARAGGAQLAARRRPGRCRTAVPAGARLERALAALRPAQRQLHRALDVARARAGRRTHSSSCIAMSEPSSAGSRSRAPASAQRWRRRYASGTSPRCSRRPCAAADSDITWKPPESVRIGPASP